MPSFHTTSINNFFKKMSASLYKQQQQQKWWLHGQVKRDEVVERNKTKWSTYLIRIVNCS